MKYLVKSGWTKLC